MNDHISDLCAKRDAITKQKNQLEKEYSEQTKKLNERLKEINEALAIIEYAAKNVLCPVCGGSGVTRYADAAGAMDEKPCADCRGTGIKIKS